MRCTRPRRRSRASSSSSTSKTRPAMLLLAQLICGAIWVIVMEQMAERGVYVLFTKLTVDPFRGLVARDVQVFNDEQRQQPFDGADGGHNSLSEKRT